EPCGNRLLDEGSDLLHCDAVRVVLQHHRLALEYLAERPERDALAVGKAASERDLCLYLERPDELAYQAALADPRVAQDGDERGRALPADAGERRLQDVELAVASHQGRREPRYAAELGCGDLPFDG